MVKRRSIPTNILRRLYAHSGNCCAFEGCNNPIFEDDGTLTGECCHIESYSPEGPRYKEHQTDKERNGYKNLMLMCSRHHKIIDSHPVLYSVEKLKELKNTHESQFMAHQLEATSIMLKQLQDDSKKYWSSLKLIDEKDSTGFKMELGENDIYSLMKEIKGLYDGLKSAIEFVKESSMKLQDDLKLECEKCGIDFNLFDKNPYYDNSLINRDWEMINLALPNHMTMLRTRYLQLCVNILEKLVIYDKDYMELYERYKKKVDSFTQDRILC